MPELPIWSFQPAVAGGSSEDTRASLQWRFENKVFVGQAETEAPSPLVALGGPSVRPWLRKDGRISTKLLWHGEKKAASPYSRSYYGVLQRSDVFPQQEPGRVEDC